MKELSVFIDESGDFGEYEKHCPYYLISMIFHDQNKNISGQVKALNNFLKDVGFTADFYIHASPAIRREREYKNISLEARRKLIANLMAFFRKTDTKFEVFHIEKKHTKGTIDAANKLSKLISIFLQNHQKTFYEYDKIKIYYDNGQNEVTKIIVSVFSSLLQNVDFKKATPSKYKLFQASDLVCTLELLKLKLSKNALSKSELTFFGSKRKLQKNYLIPFEKKRLS